MSTRGYRTKTAVPVPPLVADLETRVSELEQLITALSKTLAALSHEVEDIERAVHMKIHPYGG